MDAARQEGYRAGAALFSAFVIGRPGRECTHFCLPAGEICRRRPGKTRTD